MSDYIFSSHQIANMAAQVEAAGIEFYQHLSTYNKDDEIKKFFKKLVKAEEKHKEVFEDLAREFAKNDVQHEYSINVIQLIQDDIDGLKKEMFDFSDNVSEIHDMERVFKMAMHSEKRAINIYSEIYKKFNERFGTLLLVIIEEEKSHLKDLEKYYQKYS